MKFIVPLLLVPGLLINSCGEHSKNNRSALANSEANNKKSTNENDSSASKTEPKANGSVTSNGSKLSPVGFAIADISFADKTLQNSDFCKSPVQPLGASAYIHSSILNYDLIVVCDGQGGKGEFLSGFNSIFGKNYIGMAIFKTGADDSLVHFTITMADASASNQPRAVKITCEWLGSSSHTYQLTTGRKDVCNDLATNGIVVSIPDQTYPSRMELKFPDGQLKVVTLTEVDAPN